MLSNKKRSMAIVMAGATVMSAKSTNIRRQYCDRKC